MLFLLNNAVLDISDPARQLQGLPHAISAQDVAGMEIARVHAIVREAVFQNPKLAKDNPEYATSLAAMVHLRQGVNAALALTREGAREPSQVFLRFRTLDPELVEYMAKLQEQGTLTFPAVQVAVWAKAA